MRVCMSVHTLVYVYICVCVYIWCMYLTPYEHFGYCPTETDGSKFLSLWEKRNTMKGKIDKMTPK